MRQSSKFEPYGNDRWKRGNAKPGAGSRRGHRCRADGECQQARGKRRQVQTRATRAHDELMAVEMEGSLRTLMADDASGRIHHRGRPRDRGNWRSNRQWSDEDRRDPQQQPENEKTSESQRWPPPGE